MPKNGGKMEKAIGESIQQHFGSIPEPRIERTRLHELMDILVIAICGVICGADSWEDIAEFGQAREEWLRTILKLPNETVEKPFFEGRKLP